jgi:hypothetical protein
MLLVGFKLGGKPFCGSNMIFGILIDSGINHVLNKCTFILTAISDASEESE